MFIFTAFQSCGNIAVGVTFKTCHFSIAVICLGLFFMCSNVALFGVFYVQDTLTLIFFWFSFK